MCSSDLVPRKERLLIAVRSLFQDLSGSDLSTVDPSTDLLELGLDSLLLTQAATLLRRRFGVTISFRQLMEDLTSLDALAGHLDAVLSPEAEPVPVTPPVEGQAVPTAPVTQSTLEQLLHQQQQVMNQLLELMGRPAAGVTGAAQKAPVSTERRSAPKSHGPFKPVDPAAGMALTPQQSQFLAQLIERYTKRTAGSKDLAAKNRHVLADRKSTRLNSSH